MELVDQRHHTRRRRRRDGVSARARVDASSRARRISAT